MSEKSNVEKAQDLIAEFDQKIYATPPSPEDDRGFEPSNDPKARRAAWEPNKTIVSLWQHSMYGAWTHFGAAGLADCVYDHARGAQQEVERAHWT